MNRTWNGARWWKFDFHSHTPASNDYGKGPLQAQLQGRTPREWLLDYMRAGIDCVAITDHNSGAWIDRLKEELAGLEKENHPDFHPLYLFPGIELSVHGGIHLLAIFNMDKTTSDIDRLLGAVGYTGIKGASDSVTTKSFGQVVDEITATGGITIPAHVDEPNGLFNLQGATLAQALACDDVFACEQISATFREPELYKSKKRTWTKVLGTDAHHPFGENGQTYPGSRFTWIKMGSPNIEGLRLALLDGSLSVLKSDLASTNPNEHAELVIETVGIASARYMGKPHPLGIELNPWLNAVIGGRGTGKSTLVEFLRICLRRDGEIPDELKSEFEKYHQVYGDREGKGLLTNDTTLGVIYNKNGTRYKIQWQSNGSIDPIHEEKDGEWVRTEGEIRQRFPVRIYSQKQIFQLAKTPLALLHIVDEAPEVDYRAWREQWNMEESRFFSLRAKAREIEAGLQEEPRLRGELEDVKLKLLIFEKSGHADILKAYQKRRRQQQATEGWETTWADADAKVRQLAAEIIPDTIDATNFDASAPEDKELITQSAKTRDQLIALVQKMEELATSFAGIRTAWMHEKDISSWKQSVDKAATAYFALQSQLSAAGAGDPSSYGVLVQRRQTIEQQIKDMENRKNQIIDLRDQAAQCLIGLKHIRRQITAARKTFLENTLRNNKYVQIKVVPYGAKETVESEFRKILQKESGGFDKDIGTPEGEGLLAKLYAAGSDAETIETSLQDVKQGVKAIAVDVSGPDVVDKRFAAHLSKLLPEAFDRLDVWYPEDSLDVRYSTSGESQNFRPIQEGSPGQRTAALLAFLLSYGQEPLILDQPEDDLDNHLIYDLIVTQLREVKRLRQVIVVTHNANIVVNGDAELVVALTARAGQTQIEASGSLQEKSVRETICTVMEGGKKAFEQRYRRIALEGRHV